MTHAELHERQGWTLQQKIDHSLEVIETFVSRMGGLIKFTVPSPAVKIAQFYLTYAVSSIPILRLYSSIRVTNIPTLYTLLKNS